MKFKNFKKKLLVLVFSFLMLFSTFGTTQAHAEVFGGKWTKDIKIYFESNTIATGPMGVAVLSWNSKLSEINAPIRIYTVYSSSEANVHVTTTDFYGQATAQAFNYPTEFSSVFTGGQIIVNLNKFDFLSNSQRVAVATHELGHILGLAHTGGGQSSIMYEYITEKNLSFPTTYDKSQLDILY